MSFNVFISNSSGKLDDFIKLINESVSEVNPVVNQELNLDTVDIVFEYNPTATIKEYGIGGVCYTPYLVNVQLDPGSKFLNKENIKNTLFHEIHHAKRWVKPGYGGSLGKAMISEGMATLYEEEKSGHTPSYAIVEINQKTIDRANKQFNSKKYSHYEWFFGGGEIVRWFGYTYGYLLCKEYAKRNSTTASRMVSLPASEIFKIHQYIKVKN